MNGRFNEWAVRNAVLLLVSVGGSTASWAAPPDPQTAFDREIAPVLKQACGECHGARPTVSRFRVDQLTADFTDRDNAAAWQELRNAINLGEMPPADEPRLPVAFIAATSRWITANLREVERSRLSTGGRSLLRRLNRHEYTHTVSDLLAIKFAPGESPLDTLPPDGTAAGFDKVSSALLLDPSLMAQYYRVARRIAERAIVDGPPEFPTATMRMEFEEIANSPAISYLLRRRGMNAVPGGLELVEGRTRSFGMLRYPGRQDNNVAPVNGFYRFTLRAGASPGVDGRRPRVRLAQSHPDETLRTILEVEVEAAWDQPREYTVTIPRDALGGELSVELLNAERLTMGQRPGEDFRRRNTELGKLGRFSETLRLAGRQVAEGWGGDRSTPDPDKLDLTRYPRVFLDYLEVEGPLYEQWPPKSHTTLLFRGAEATGDMAYAREIFGRFLPRAWRRPVAPAELEPILRVVANELASGESFHEAIRVGLAAALTSPKFLYLAEPLEGDDGTRKLSGHELAARLSYFLWSSLPDKKLSAAAANGSLADHRVLAAEVERLLKDPRIQRFVDGFAGQWLRTETFLAFAPDRNLYREYDDQLAEAVVREPLEFFRELLLRDLSVVNFLDSDFAVVNARLARHYQIPGVQGEQFRQVPLPPDSPRGGLLAMAGVHQAGSDGIRTKPVARAVYVREVLFNSPPDPPPPNAGEVEPNLRGKQLTVRERLLQHQQHEACGSCHRNLDPYGLALENFNAIGSWRDRQDGEDFRGDRRPLIDASGRLPNGRRFRDFDEYRQLLLEQQDRFRRALAEKLLVYALGRPVDPSDDAALDHAVQQMRAGDDSLRTLITSLVTSKQFHTK